MSSTVPFDPVIVRADEAEHLEAIGHTLLADSSATHGALSTHRIRLGRGEDGAMPHHHAHSAELFYVTDGVLDVLVGDRVLSAHAGDLVVVPPHVAHAFGAHRGSSAEALIVITPGVERFEYFRHVVRIREGRQLRETLLALQEHYDTHFLTSAEWLSARTDEAVARTAGGRP